MTGFEYFLNCLWLDLFGAKSANTRAAYISVTYMKDTYDMVSCIWDISYRITCFGYVNGIGDIKHLEIHLQ